MPRSAKLALVTVLLVFAWPGVVSAQPAALLQPRVSSVPTTGIPVQPPPAPDPVPDNESSVAFLDSALPRNTIRTRFDATFYNRTPTMAEFYQPKGGLPFTPGPPIPERNIHMMELNTYAEYAFQPWLSIFFETPIRWVNPDFNRNEHGVGDVNLGFKMVAWQDTAFLATFQFRGTLPTASSNALGTDHVSIEPAILVNWRIADYLTLEGEVRYWVPLDGTDFSGRVLRYGLGISYGQRSASEIWVTPVLEAVGWSVLGGKAMHVTAPDQFTIDNVGDSFIFNACLGVRIGMGKNADVYFGYSRCLSGPSWYREDMRIEFRLLF